MSRSHDEDDRSQRTGSGRGSQGRGAPRKASGRGGSYGAPKSGSKSRGGDRRKQGDRRGAGSGDSRGTGSRSYEVPKGPKGWGRVARKGADSARRDDGRGQPQTPRDHGPPSHDSEKWERVPEERRGRPSAKRRSPRFEIHVAEESLAGLSQSDRDRLRRRIGEAASAFSAERYEECRKILTPLAKRHSTVPELRELAGLCFYRLGRWQDALGHLEAFRASTGSTDQHPVMADIQRALGHDDEVRRLWDELRHDDADAAVITEGRIVLAGSMADRGDLDGAIRVLEQGPVRTKRPLEYHLRLWYSLADLYERAGELAKARRGFDRIQSVDHDFADATDRLRSLA